MLLRPRKNAIPGRNTDTDDQSDQFGPNLHILAVIKLASHLHLTTHSSKAHDGAQNNATGKSPGAGSLLHYSLFTCFRRRKTEENKWFSDRRED